MNGSTTVLCISRPSERQLKYIKLTFLDNQQKQFRVGFIWSYVLSLFDKYEQRIHDRQTVANCLKGIFPKISYDSGFL